MAFTNSDKRTLYAILADAFTLMAQGRTIDDAIASATSHKIWPLGMADLEKRISRAVDG